MKQTVRVQFHKQDEKGFLFITANHLGERPVASKDPFFNVGMAERQAEWDATEASRKVYRMVDQQVPGIQLMTGPFLEGKTYTAELIDENTIKHPIY